MGCGKEALDEAEAHMEQRREAKGSRQQAGCISDLLASVLSREFLFLM